MYALNNVIQPYAWGSRSAISDLLGTAPTGGPEAELWMGAHPSGPSRIGPDDDAPTLLDVVDADPVGVLGPDVAAQFGGRLPFLLKVLAAEMALSIQTHPTRAQAEAGYAAENARGLAPNDPTRNYVDDWPKPEILCALTDFEGLAGLRTAEEAADLLQALAVPALGPVIRTLREKPEPDSVARVLGRILQWPQETRAELVADVVGASRRLASEAGPHAAAYDAVVRVSADHPGDLGLVCTLLLKHIVLKPGEAFYLVAGGLHAYLKGTGIELMANSDNVLRAGLTPKHIDVRELLCVVDPAVEVPLVRGRRVGPGVEVFDTSAPEFRLYRVTLDADAGSDERLTLPGTGPRIVLCVEGAASLRGTGDVLSLAKGRSCFIADCDGSVEAVGSGTLFVAAPGI